MMGIPKPWPPSAKILLASRCDRRSRLLATVAQLAAPGVPALKLLSARSWLSRSTARARTGSPAISRSKSFRSISSNSTALADRAVAVRELPLSSAISPNASPSPRLALGRSPSSISTLPLATI
jgi:hypothetical protein